MITYRDGDATQPVGDGPKIIVHVCNDVGLWGAGFVLALSQRWAEPEQEYKRWFRHWSPPGAARQAGEGVIDSGMFRLGAAQLVSVAADLWVANIIGQRSVRWGTDGTPPVRYNAIRDGLEWVNGHAVELGATIHGPRFGAGLAGGDWTLIAGVIERAVTVPVTIYDWKG